MKIFNISVSIPAIVMAGLWLFMSPVYGQESGERTSSKSSAAEASISYHDPMAWSTQVVLSSYVGDGHAEGYIDLLIPLLQNDNGMLFLYPRFGMSSDVNSGYSMGLGARHYLPAIDAIIGANVFYDRYASPNDNYYNQISLGLEVLTRWVDARFNYYIPDSSPNMIDSQNVRSRTQTQSASSSWGEPFATGYTIRQPFTTTTRTTTTTVNQLFERFEDTMQGYDAEIGVLTPWLERYVALRWFAGYYNFDNSYGDDLSGFKGRAELRFSSKLAIDATYYQDEEITGGNWLFGFRMSIPVFMENLADGRSPFEGSFTGMFDGVNFSGRKRGQEALKGVGSGYPSGSTAMSPFAALAPAPSFAAASSRSSSVRDRMTEVVLRLPGARTSESDFIENLAARDVNVDVDIDRSTRIVVIDDSIVFVNNASGTVAGPGTFENPLDTIQGGVNRASVLFGNRGDVMVAGTGTNYAEDVVDANSSVRVWGGGRGFPVNGGRRFTYGSQPILDGGFQITSVPMFSLSGFAIENGFFNTNGLVIDSVNDLTIVNNDISALFSAVQVTYPIFTEDAVVRINDNVLRDSNIGLDLIIDADMGATVETSIVGNRFVDNANRNFVISIDNSGADVSTALVNNSVIGGGAELSINGNAGSMTTTLVEGNQFLGQGLASIGLDASIIANIGSIVTTLITGNQFLDHSPGIGLRVDIDSDGATTSTSITNNVANRNNIAGIELFGNASNNSTYTAVVSGNQTIDNGNFGLRVHTNSNSSVTSTLIANNTSLRNTWGYVVVADVEGAPLTNMQSRIQILGNVAEENSLIGLDLGVFRIQDTGSAFFLVDIIGNQITNNNLGMEFNPEITGDPLVPGNDTPVSVTIFGNNFSNNMAEGAVIDALYANSTFSSLRVIGNEFSNIGGITGLQLGLDVEDSNLTVNVSGNQAVDNFVGDGLNLVVISRDSSTVNTTIMDNIAIGNGRMGLRLAIDTDSLSTDSTTITDNQLNNNAFDGLFIDLDSISSSNLLTVEDNVFLGNTDGLRLLTNVMASATLTASINRNRFQDNGDDGIEIFNFTNGSSSSQFGISNNVILGNGAGGLDLDVNINNDSIYNASIIDNEITGNAGNGVLLEVDYNNGSSALTNFANNAVLNNGLNGFDVQLVAENVAGAGTGSGIAFFGNAVENNALDGLALDLFVNELGGGLYIVNLLGNQFLNNGLRGMSMLNSDITAGPAIGNDTIVTINVANNVFAGNVAAGLFMTGDITNITALSSLDITDNQFLNNGLSGLVLTIDADNSFLPVEISGNIISNSGASSITLGVTGPGTVDFSSTFNNITSGAGTGLSLFDLGTPSATGDILLNGAVINFPDPGDIAE